MAFHRMAHRPCDKHDDEVSTNTHWNCTSCLINVPLINSRCLACKTKNPQVTVLQEAYKKQYGVSPTGAYCNSILHLREDLQKPKNCWTQYGKARECVYTTLYKVVGA